jgi:hypothetical protein
MMWHLGNTTIGFSPEFFQNYNEMKRRTTRQPKQFHELMSPQLLLFLPIHSSVAKEKRQQTLKVVFTGVY